MWALAGFERGTLGEEQGKPLEAGLADRIHFGIAGDHVGKAGLGGRLRCDLLVDCRRSLGGTVLVDLAARDGARALILQNAFCSLPRMPGIRERRVNEMSEVRVRRLRQRAALPQLRLRFFAEPGSHCSLRSADQAGGRAADSKPACDRRGGASRSRSNHRRSRERRW